MLKGLVTETDAQAVEDAFPGIWGYYRELAVKPCTFLELVWRFAGCTAHCAPDDDHPSRGPSQS